MRVALLSYNAQFGDAIGNQVARKLRFFRARGAEVRVFVESARRLHPALEGHVTVVAPAQSAEAHLSYLMTADLIVVEYGLSYSMLWWLPVLARGPARIVFDYHGVTPAELWGTAQAQHLRTGAAHRRMALFADAAIAHSDFTRRELIRHTGIPIERVTCVGLPVDRERFRPGRPRRDLRERLDIRHARVLLFVGRLAPHKRVPVLVEALAQLRELNPPVHAVIVGDTGDLFEAEKTACCRRAAALGIGDRLHFLGCADEQELPDAYRSADALVMPSKHEGFCVPVVEAMASGVPVIAANAAALPETVGEAGLLFEPDNSAELAEQIRRLLMRDCARQLSEQGLIRAAAFADEEWEKRFAGVIERVLHGPARVFFERAEVRPRQQSRRVSTDLDCLLLPVKLLNRGSHPLTPEGEARWILQASMTDQAGKQVGETTVPTPLSGILAAGRSEDFLIAVPIPPEAGRYQISIRAEQPERDDQGARSGAAGRRTTMSVANVRLTVAPAVQREAQRLRERIETLLVQADRLKVLPDDYLDVSEGWFAGWKRRLKAKLLGNFRRAYVDVMSRQQTAFNGNVIAAVHELADLHNRLEDSLRRLDQEKNNAGSAHPTRQRRHHARKAGETV